jgi:hypothetical protein
MKKISAEKIEDGMVLGRDVCGASGSILLSKGSSLSQSMGRRLINWGISFVYVEGEEVHEQEENSVTTSPEEIKSQLMEKFSDTINNPIMKTLFVAVYQYKLQKNSK